MPAQGSPQPYGGQEAAKGAVHRTDHQAIAAGVTQQVMQGANPLLITPQHQQAMQTMPTVNQQQWMDM
eukprot:3963706-Karenia_brevis.AAC.1